MFFSPLRSVEVLSSDQERCGSSTEAKAGHFCVSSNTSSMESLWLSGINKEHTRPPSSSLFIARGAVRMPMTFAYIDYGLF